MPNPVSERRSDCLDIYEWRDQCNLARQKCEFLQEKINDLTKERDSLKIIVDQLQNSILTYLNAQHVNKP